jgi:polysaccharide biosynthesis protein PslH
VTIPAAGRRSRVLFVVPVTPAESGNGLAMRAGLFLDALAGEHDVSLFVIPVAGPAPTSWPPFVSERTRERVCLRVENRQDEAFTRAAALPAGPRQVAALRSYPRPALCRFATDEVVQAAQRMFSGPPFDVVFIMRLYLAPFLPALLGADSGRTRAVLDLDDDDVETRRRVAALHARLAQPALMLFEAAEAEKYRALEADWLPRFDHVLVCSERDRAAVQARAGHPAIHVVPNGVRRPDTAVAGSPETGECVRLLFVGSLSYFPNVDAATVLCRDVLPRLRARLQRDVRVDVVGSRPSPAVAALADIPGVTVHADVARVAPFYAEAQAVVTPLRAGGGTRLKILEAFAHGVPVISTSVGAEGLDVVSGQHLWIAEGPEELVDACQRLFETPGLAGRLRAEALQVVATRYDAAVVAEGIRTLFREHVRPGRTDVDLPSPPTHNHRTERTMDWSRVLQRTEGLEVNELSDGYVIYQPQPDRVHYLNRTAVLVLEMCNGAITADEILHLVKNAYDLPEPPTAEVAECLTKLLDEGLIRSV